VFEASPQRRGVRSRLACQVWHADATEPGKALRAGFIYF
jgi:hypothetical protein